MEHYSPQFTLMGMVFDIPTVIMTLVSSLIVFLIIVWATRNLTSQVPTGMQNFLEWVIDFVRGIAKQSMDAKTAERFVALGLTLFLYIFIGNQLGLMLNVITTHTEPSQALQITNEMIQEAQAQGHHGVEVLWWKSPTAAVSVPISLALAVIIYSNWLGARHDYLKSYFQPHWGLLPLNIIEEASKLLSLPLRLFGNIFAGEVLIALLVPLILAGGISILATLPLVVWLGYSVFVGSVQAFIFTTLTMVYISHRIHSEDAH
jgi:F-type H+-transporting ATPase subunit a